MFEDMSLGAPDNAVGFVMWRIVARYGALTGVDLTHLQFMLLAPVACCGRSGEAVKQIELARSGGITQPIRVLETKKLLCRTRSRIET